MARPIKDGVEYFPLDVNFFDDDKVKILRQKHKAKGMYMLLFLLCDLYRKNGYFMEWDEVKQSLLVDEMRCADEISLARLVEGCLSCGFFDKRVFEAYGVLTSAGIQRRYIRMFKSREMIYMTEEYFLLDLSDPKDVPPGILNKLALKKVFSTENPDKSTENPDKSTENPQKEKKEKDTYVSQRKAEEAASGGLLLPLRDGATHLVTEETIAHYQSLYSAIDVRRELYRMKEWCESNPEKKRKTFAEIRRFINGWLSAEDREAKNKGAKAAPPEEGTRSFDTESFFDKALKRSQKVMEESAKRASEEAPNQ